MDEALPTDESVNLSVTELREMFGAPVPGWIPRHNQPSSYDDDDDEDYDGGESVVEVEHMDLNEEDKQCVAWARDFYQRIPHKDRIGGEYGTYKPGVTNDTALIRGESYSFGPMSSPCSDCGSPDIGSGATEFQVDIDGTPGDQVSLRGDDRFQFGFFTAGYAHFLAYHPDSKQAKETADKLAALHALALHMQAPGELEPAASVDNALSEFVLNELAPQEQEHGFPVQLEGTPADILKMDSTEKVEEFLRRFPSVDIKTVIGSLVSADENKRWAVGHILDTVNLRELSDEDRNDIKEQLLIFGYDDLVTRDRFPNADLLGQAQSRLQLADERGKDAEKAFQAGDKEEAWRIVEEIQHTLQDMSYGLNNMSSEERRAIAVELTHALIGYRQPNFALNNLYQFPGDFAAVDNATIEKLEEELNKVTEGYWSRNKLEAIKRRHGM